MNALSGKVKPLHIVTPLIESIQLSQYVASRGPGKSSARQVWLKLDNCQPAQSFKTRGVGHACLKAVRNGSPSIISSSGGNAGLAVAYSARKLGVPAVVVVPASTPEYMQSRLKLEGADVRVVGSVWDEAHEFAMHLAALKSAAYIPPFDHPDIWDGNATVIEELYEQMDVEPDVIVVSVGGGGYFIGVCQGLQKVGWKKTKVLTMETIGADSLNQAVNQGQLVRLDGISSVAKSLGAQIVAERALEWASEEFVTSQVVTDTQAIHACLRFAKDHKMLVEPACGASLAPIYSKLLEIYFSNSWEKIQTICVLVCGGNMTRIPFEKIDCE